MKNSTTQVTTPKDVSRMSLTAQELYDKCMALAGNLWWSWNEEVRHIFRDLDPIRWRQIDHNPIILLNEFTPERLYKRAHEMVLLTRINQAYRRLKEYMNSRNTWSSTNLFRWLGSALRRSRQERKQSGTTFCGTGSVLLTGLFQAATGFGRLSNRRVYRHARRRLANRGSNFA